MFKSIPLNHIQKRTTPACALIAMEKPIKMAMAGTALMAVIRAGARAGIGNHIGDHIVSHIGSHM